MEYPFSVQGKVYFILKSGLFSGALNFLVPVSYYLCEYFYLLLPLSLDLEVLLQCEESCPLKETVLPDYSGRSSVAVWALHLLSTP